MVKVNSLNQIGQIIEGHFKEITKQENKLSKDRMKICESCPLYTVSQVLGPICDSKKCYNIKTNISELLPGKDTVCGCSCRLVPKTLVKDAKCVLNKW